MSASSTPHPNQPQDTGPDNCLTAVDEWEPSSHTDRAGKKREYFVRRNSGRLEFALPSADDPSRPDESDIRSVSIEWVLTLPEQPDEPQPPCQQTS